MSGEGWPESTDRLSLEEVLRLSRGVGRTEMMVDGPEMGVVLEKGVAPEDVPEVGVDALVVEVKLEGGVAPVGGGVPEGGVRLAGGVVKDCRWDLRVGGVDGGYAEFNVRGAGRGLGSPRLLSVSL